MTENEIAGYTRMIDPDHRHQYAPGDFWNATEELLDEVKYLRAHVAALVAAARGPCAIRANKDMDALRLLLDAPDLATLAAEAQVRGK